MSKYLTITLVGGIFAAAVLAILLFVLWPPDLLAGLASAAGNILRDNFGIPYGAGLLIMLLVVGVLTFYGRQLITATLTFWSVFLYAVFVAFLLMVFSSDVFPGTSLFASTDIESGWWWSGIKYASYNLAGIPLLLYVARDFHTRTETVGSGVMAATIAMMPAAMFQVAFVSASPEVLGEAIPVYWMIGQLGSAFFLLIYSIMLFGTFIETGAGLLQGINERIDGYLEESRGSHLSPAMRAAIAVLAILVSAGLSLIGITELIASGYGAMALGFLAVYVLPLLTIGVYRIYRQGS